MKRYHLAEPTNSDIPVLAPYMRIVAVLTFASLTLALAACHRPHEPHYAMVEQCLDCAGLCACTPQCLRDGSPAPVEECGLMPVQPNGLHPVAIPLEGNRFLRNDYEWFRADGDPRVRIVGPIPNDEVAGGERQEDQRILEELLRCEEQPRECSAPP